MSIVTTLIQRHTDRDQKRGWICVSEKEWNAYFRSFGMMHFYYNAALSGPTLAFRGCQLRVL